jgi:D-alanyl-D-alanine carboxypeptidase/D-alanyl-D-alanine-endopeptidase (penicillin-binding protein 4)
LAHGRDSGPVIGFLIEVRAFLATLLALLAVAPAAPAAGIDATERAIERHMRQAGSHSGAYAVDLDSGAVIASVRGGSSRIPASVEKLFTTTGALLRFGADGRLPTTLYAQHAPGEDGVLRGAIYVRGSGDPTLDQTDLRTLAAQVAEAGVEKITGDVYADESAFDTLRGPPSEGYRSSQWVAPLSALAFERGRYPADRVPVFLRRALSGQGVAVPGRVRVGETPDDAVVLAQVNSPTMAELARLTNVPSDNWAAELLLKAQGADRGIAGTTATGARAARATLDEAFGFAPRMADGSGLSRANRTTPRQVVRLLAGMDRRPEGPALRASLAVAGHSGTLSSRMRKTSANGRCRGKTGTISGVSNLAGYCDTAGGARVAFAFLMNRVSPYGARTLQDRMAAALARYDGDSS